MNNNARTTNNKGRSADDELMREVANGSASAFEALYQRHAAGCYTLALKIVHSPSVAEEAVQEVFLKLWRCPASYSVERGKFSNWLFTLVRNCAMDQLRDAKSFYGRVAFTSLDKENGFESELVALLQDGGLTPYDYAWNNEQGQVIGHFLGLLKEVQRQAIVLAYFEGLTYREIAERLQEPLNTIKTRIRLGRRRLRHLLLSNGLSEDLC